MLQLEKIFFLSNLSMLNHWNQSMTAGQWLLLRWCDCFGHLDLPGAQCIVCPSTLLLAKFKIASKCDLSFVKGTTCEIAKLNPIQQVSPVSFHLNVKRLKPSIQESHDRFELCRFRNIWFLWKSVFCTSSDRVAEQTIPSTSNVHLPACLFLVVKWF